MRNLHSLAAILVGLTAASGVTAKDPVPVPSSALPQGKLVTAEVPPGLLEKMRADLAQRQGLVASAAKVVRAESIDWPNGAMGCPEPGEKYTQAIVPGYVVEFEHEGRIYAYHASKHNVFKLCDLLANKKGPGRSRTPGLPSRPVD